MKRRQTVRRLEIVAVVVVVAVSVVLGIRALFMALNSSSGLDGKPVPQTVYTLLYQTSVAPYGASSSAYSTYVHSLSSQNFTANGKPILVYVGAEYCLYCAVQRWALIMALMRFGNFTNLEYMHSGVSDGDYATFTFVASSYNSSYVVFQPYEVYDRAGNSIATLPTNYTSAFTQYGKSSFPFLNFADEYYISGAILSPTMLGTQNQTQIISSIQAGGSMGSEVKQAANLITAVICETTRNKPVAVCGQSSIKDSLVSYTPPSAGSGTELILASASFIKSRDMFIAGQDYSGWN